jgi:hypothetical protein
LEGIRKPMITAVKTAVVMANSQALFSRITIFSHEPRINFLIGMHEIILNTFTVISLYQPNCFGLTVDVVQKLENLVL